MYNFIKIPSDKFKSFSSLIPFEFFLGNLSININMY